MDIRRKLYIIFTVIALASFIAGIMVIIMADNATFKVWFCIGMVILCALFLGAAGFVKPSKEGKR